MKKKFFFFPPSPEEVKREAERIEELQRERRSAARLAHEMQLIQARAQQNDEQKRQEELQQWAFERQEWDAVFARIERIHRIYEFGG
jgi:uncharacterized protein YigA (DUF484 family)